MTDNCHSRKKRYWTAWYSDVALIDDMVFSFDYWILMCLGPDLPYSSLYKLGNQSNEWYTIIEES